MSTYLTDNNGDVVTKTAVARNVKTSLAASVKITLDPSTKYLRCYATTQDVYFKWGAVDASNGNFDEILPAGQIVDLIVPIDRTTGLKFMTFTVIQRAASAALVVIEK